MTTGICAVIWFIVLIFAVHRTSATGPKALAFRDPNTNYLYRLTSYNATRPPNEAFHKSLIKVTRIKLNERNQPTGQPESIQTLKFSPALVDFDLHCPPRNGEHCYLVTVTSRTRRNVELFSWQRTQFDLSAVKDSFARPSAVKLIGVNSGFYIAIAQEQLQLSPYRYALAASDDDEPTRFMGCAVLKFTKGREHDVKYHQFIRLPFNPSNVNHFTTVNSNTISDSRAIVGPTQNYHLVFSTDPNWADPEARNVRSFIWSPLNEYFWPYRMPHGAEVVRQKPGVQVLVLPEPHNLPPFNATQNQQGPQEYIGGVEACFYQLERLLSDRDLEARRLIQSSTSIWRASDGGNQYAQAAPQLSNITAQVIVRGNVIVRGSVIDNPQISLIGANPTMPLEPQQVNVLVSSHSPTNIENKLKLAMLKLNYIRKKMESAIYANSTDRGPFLSPVRFFEQLRAGEVVLRGVTNSDVRLNGIPFKQLENELVSLNGAQSIAGQVVFAGKVVADRLEIRALINDNYYLKDAVDILSDRIQIIDTTNHSHVMQVPNQTSLNFRSVSTPDVILAYNATVNSIRLNDFITRDNRTQVVSGRKTFRRLSMSRLDMAHQSVLLNDVNISRIARNAIRLRTEQQGNRYQSVLGKNEVTFAKTIFADKISFGEIINQHINLTSLIHDSIKTNSYEVQQIFGMKNFQNGLKIGHLNTEGALNGIEVSQIFNLNAAPPVTDQHLIMNRSGQGLQYDTPIEGQFKFKMPTKVLGNVNANLVNGIDIARRAIRRSPSLYKGPPQIVRGHKKFYRPLRVINDIRVIDLQQASQLLGNNTQISFPLVNNIDMRSITAGLARQMQQPPPIFVENLEIEGNLDISTQRSGTFIIGNYSTCPLDLIRSRVVLASSDGQTVKSPIRVNTLRAKSVLVDPEALNGYNFPEDFVMRTLQRGGLTGADEPIFGVKTVDHLVVSPALVANLHTNDLHGGGRHRQVFIESGTSINQVPYSALQAYINHERNLNSTGEKYFNTMNVYGNIHAKRINGYYWPEDILLRSLSSHRNGPPRPFVHRRIYSHLIFTNTSHLRVENQLVLRGPVQLNGLMNGVNLTEFGRQSATYGDKDLFSAGRPIRNKIFMGGLTVHNEVRAQGLIDGVSFDEMRRRVVTVNPSHGPVFISSPKIFTDVSFDAPVKMLFLNGIPVDNYLSRIRFEPDGITLRVHNKKTITGALRINRNLFVRGPINGVDFSELQARAISLAPTKELIFNKTLIVEGDVFMDNLWIDEKNGTIDGVKLRNLLQLGPDGNEEFALTDPHVARFTDNDGHLLQVFGLLMDCQIACTLRPMMQYRANQSNFVGPVTLPTRSIMSITSRPTLFNTNANYTITRTTPPYSLASSYQLPLRPTPIPVQTEQPVPLERPVHLNHPVKMHHLATRRPMSVRYEPREEHRKRFIVPKRPSFVPEQLEYLRRQIVSINLIRLTRASNLVVGFIDAPTNDISSYTLPDYDLSHSDHTSHRESYLQLDQVDFTLNRTLVTHHLSVGVETNRNGPNMTAVSQSRDGNLLHISTLPVEFPNAATFFAIPDGLFLIISQDSPANYGMCRATEIVGSFERHVDGVPDYRGPGVSQVEEGVHVYMFFSLKNSSLLTDAYFDLYQTMDLPQIDSFEKFSYDNSHYVLAISRELNRVYLLLLRGYTGFQVVSNMHIPMIESVDIFFAKNKPVLVIRQTNGRHRVMEAVII